MDILRFNRCVCLTESDLDTLELGYDERHPPSEQHQSQQLLEAGGADTGGEKKSDGVPCAILPADRSSRLRAGTTVENDQSARSSRGRTQFVGDDGSGEPDGGQEEDDPLAMGFPCRALSAGNELAALTEIVVLLLEARDAYPTTLEHDEARTMPRSSNRSASVLLLMCTMCVASRVSQKPRGVIAGECVR